MLTKIVWVNPKTGEVVDEEFEGAVGLEEDVTPTDPDSVWLGDWLTKQDVQLTAEEKAIKAQMGSLLKIIKARRAYLKFGYEERLKTVVRTRLKEQGGKKKSVSFNYGNSGWRSGSRILVDDEAKALEWAREHCTAAVKTTPMNMKTKR